MRVADTHTSVVASLRRLARTVAPPNPVHVLFEVWLAVRLGGGGGLDVRRCIHKVDTTCLVLGDTFCVEYRRFLYVLQFEPCLDALS